jgi:hypothetical protein
LDDMDSGRHPLDRLAEQWAPLMDAVRTSGAQVTSTVKLPSGMDLDDAVFSGRSIREDAARSNTITLDPSTAPRVTNTVWVAPGGRTIPASAFAFHVDGPDFRHAKIADLVRAVCTIEVPADGWPEGWRLLGDGSYARTTSKRIVEPDGAIIVVPNTEPGRRAAWLLEGAR